MLNSGPAETPFPDLEDLSRRQQADVAARLVLRDVLARLEELTGEPDESGALAMADRACVPSLSLAILSVKRDALLALEPDGPLAERSRRVLLNGYAALGIPGTPVR